MQRLRIPAASLLSRPTAAAAPPPRIAGLGLSQSDGPAGCGFRRGPFGCGPARHWGVVRARWVSVTPGARSVPAGLSSPGLGPACALWGRSGYGVAAICWVSVRPLRRALSRFPSSLSVLRPSLLSLPAGLVSLSGRAWLCFVRFSFDESLSLPAFESISSPPAPWAGRLTAHCSLLTAHCSLLTAHCSPYRKSAPRAPFLPLSARSAPFRDSKCHPPHLPPATAKQTALSISLARVRFPRDTRHTWHGVCPRFPVCSPCASARGPLRKAPSPGHTRDQVRPELTGSPRRPPQPKGVPP
jgi:hypothetical protein